jgi:predicted DNA-binding protein YlxM (UPF0122 family)
MRPELEEVSSLKTEILLIILLNLLRNDEPLNSCQRNLRITELYESGLSMKEVGLEFGVSAQRVEQILKKAGVETRKYTRSNRLLQARRKKRKVLSKELLLKFYKEERLPVFEIIEKLGISHPLLYENLEFHNIPKRKTEEIGHSKLTEGLLRRLYLEEDLTAKEIAQKLGFAPITIKKRLCKFGIRKRDRQT